MFTEAELCGVRQHTFLKTALQILGQQTLKFFNFFFGEEKWTEINWKELKLKMKLLELKKIKEYEGFTI